MNACRQTNIFDISMTASPPPSPPPPKPKFRDAQQGERQALTNSHVSSITSGRQRCRRYLDADIILPFHHLRVRIFDLRHRHVGRTVTTLKRWDRGKEGRLQETLGPFERNCKSRRSLLLCHVFGMKRIQHRTFYGTKDSPWGRKSHVKEGKVDVVVIADIWHSNPQQRKLVSPL